MPNATVRGPTHATAHHNGHPGGRNGVDFHHCVAQCQYCGPDSSAWALGGLVVSLFVAVGAAARWLVRHPTAALVLAVVAMAAGTVAGGR
jgi:hypothetical protein